MGFNISKALGTNSGLGGKALSIMAPGLQETAGALGLGPKVGTPELERAQLNQDAADILSQRTENANKDPAEYENDIVNEQNANTSGAGFLLAGGGVDSPMKDAIAQRQNKQFASQTNKMKQSDRGDAASIRAGRITSSLGAIRNDALNAIKFAEKQKVAQQNKQFARNNAIATVFKNVGTIVGTVAGAYFGGPEGAKVGASAGQGAGNAVGAETAGPTGNLNYL